MRPPINRAQPHFAAGTPGTDDSAQGIVIEFLAVEAITQWDAVYVSTTTGRVGRADANDAANTLMLAVGKQQDCIILNIVCILHDNSTISQNVTDKIKIIP